MTGSEARFIEAKHRAMDEYSKSYVFLMKLRLDILNGKCSAEAEQFYTGIVDGTERVLFNVFGMTDKEVGVLHNQAEQFFNTNYLNKEE